MFSLTTLYVAWDVVYPKIRDLIKKPEVHAKLQALSSKLNTAKSIDLPNINASISMLDTAITSTCGAQPPWYIPFKRAAHKKACDAYITSLEEATTKLHLVNANIRSLENEKAMLIDERDKYFILFKNGFYDNFNNIAYLLLLVLFGPSLWRTLLYYGILPLTEATSPLQLSPSDIPGKLCIKNAGKSFTVTVTSTCPLSVREIIKFRMIHT